MPPFPRLLPPLLPRLLLYNHSGLLRREIQPIQIQPTPIIHHNPLYAICSLVLLNLFFQFQQCFVSRRVVGVGRVGTNGGVAPPATLLRPSTRAGRSFWGFAWGASPRRLTLFSHPRIIYDGNESINNSRNRKNTPRRRGAAPPRSPKGAEQLYVFLKKCGTSASREWSIFFKNTHTQTSTPSTNPYDSNLRRARTHRIKSRASSEYQPVQNNSYFYPIRWNNPPVVRNERR